MFVERTKYRYFCQERMHSLSNKKNGVFWKQTCVTMIIQQKVRFFSDIRGLISNVNVGLSDSKRDMASNNGGRRPEINRYTVYIGIHCQNTPNI